MRTGTWLICSGKGSAQFFGYAVYEPNIRGNHLICDGAARAALGLLTELSGGARVPVEEVVLSRSAPADLTAWRESFGERLRFDGEQTAVIFPASWLNRPVEGADPELRASLQARMQGHFRSGELDVLTRLRRELRVALLGGPVEADAISANLGMSRRTLNRRLEASGTRFQDVLNETRCEFAKQLLATTRLKASAVGAIIGYESPTVFARGFLRWTGMPPGEWRAQRLAASAG